MSVSDRTRRAWTSRLDPINWPSGTGIVLFVAWVAYAVVSTVWLHLLLLDGPSDGPGAVPLRRALSVAGDRDLRHPADGPDRLRAGRRDVGRHAALDQLRDLPDRLRLFLGRRVRPEPRRLDARLPGWLLGKRFSARLAWSRFESSLVAANALVRQTNAGGDQTGRHAALGRLATQARRESGRDRTWLEAWAAHAAWLDGLDTLAGIEPTPDQIRPVNDLLDDANRVHMRAIEQTAVLDPAAR